jgi:hypothetical protein
MSLITPHLYLGDANNSRDFNFLMSKNITLIVNCAKEINNFYSGRFKYLNLGLDDVPSQNIVESLRMASDTILQHMKKGGITFVHCAAGISRSSSVVIYTIMRLHDWDYEKTFKYVKSMHERTNPNPGFVEQLIKMQAGTPDTIDHGKQKIVETFLDIEESGRPERLERSEEPERPFRSEENQQKQVEELPIDIDKVNLNSSGNERPAYNRNHKGMYARIFS